MKKIISFFFFLFLLENIIAQTIIGGILSQNTIFTKTNSPYLITSNLTIPQAFFLEIEPGCEINLLENVEIIVNGTFKAIGNQSDTIYFKSSNKNTLWSGITATMCSIEFEYVKLTDSKKIINQNYGNLKLINSLFSNINGFDGIALHSVKKAFIDKCKLVGIKNSGKIDAIDCDAADSITVTNCQIENWGDDAIDIGMQTSHAYIAYNFVKGCDYGLSVGENSKAFAERNIFIKNHGGFQSHYGATLIADHNTLYNNTFGVQCFHGGDANSGGNAHVKNTIFSNRNKNDYQIQTSSLLTISYCLSDKENLLGNNNILANPNFIDTTAQNFSLNAHSPCIDAGDFTSAKDSDGSITDIGAITYKSDINTIIHGKKIEEYILFPSPNFGNFSLFSLNGKKIEKVQILNEKGIVFFSSTTPKISFEFTNFARGVYFCKIKINKQIFTEKIVVF